MSFFIYSASGNSWPIEDSIPNLKTDIKNSVGKSFRRTNHFIDLALLGANRCINNSAREIASDCGVFVATGQGNIVDGIEINKQLFVQQEAPMPFTFINVSNNLAGFYIAQSLNLSSSNITISRRNSPFEAALEIASLDLEQGNIAYCLVGGVDECALPLEQHCERMSLATNTPLSEGSSWLYIGTSSAQAIAKCEMLSVFDSIDALINELILYNWPQNCQLAVGYSVSETESIEILQRLNLKQQYDYVAQARYHDTHSAYGIASFIERFPGQHVLHINKDYQGKFYITYITALMDSAEN